MFRRREVRDPVNVLFKGLTIIAVILLVYVFGFSLAWSLTAMSSGEVNVSELLYALSLSIGTAGASSSLALITSIPISYYLARSEFRGKKLVQTLLLLPLALPPVALGILLFIFFTKSPLGTFINNYLNVVFDVKGLIVAQFAVILPISIRILTSVFSSLNPNYENLALVLGFNRLWALLKVILPMIKNPLMSTYALLFSRALGEFGASVMLAGATRFRTETIPIALYLAFNSGDLWLTSSIILASMLASATLLLVIQAWEGEGVVA